MKTIEDLNKMKLKSCPPFGSTYDYLIETLSDYYIAKVNGKERIKSELNGWDKEAQLYIITILVKRIAQSIKDFDSSDLLELVN